jgi:hypothetical protein
MGKNLGMSRTDSARKISPSFLVCCSLNKNTKHSHYCAAFVVISIDDDPYCRVVFCSHYLFLSFGPADNIIIMPVDTAPDERHKVILFDQAFERVVRTTFGIRLVEGNDHLLVDVG